MNLNDTQRVLLTIAFHNGPEWDDLFAWYVAKYATFGATCRALGTEMDRKAFWTVLSLETYKPFEDKGLCGTPLYMAPEQVAAGLR